MENWKYHFFEVWTDKWLFSNVNLAEVAMRNIPDELVNLSLANYFDQQCGWALNGLMAYLPVEVLAEINTILGPDAALGTDEVV